MCLWLALRFKGLKEIHLSFVVVGLLCVCVSRNGISMRSFTTTASTFNF